MATVYDKAGKAHECGDADAKVLIASGHFLKSLPQKPESRPKDK